MHNVVSQPTIATHPGVTPTSIREHLDSVWKRTVHSIALLGLLGAPQARAQEANALILDGANDYATAAATVYPNRSTPTSFTVEAWIRPTQSDSMIVMDDAYGLILFHQYGAGNGGVGIRATLYDGVGSSTAKVEFRDIQLNACNHVALMFDATTSKFWIAINGVLSTSPSDFGSPSFYSDPDRQLTVGSDGSTGFYSGLIDELRISSVVRYSADFTPPDTLTVDADTKGMWRFNEGTGSTRFGDSSSGHVTLTGQGGAATGASPCSPSTSAPPSICTDCLPSRGGWRALMPE